MLTKLSAAPVGSVVQFVYNGGSQYGATRKVKVTENLGYGIRGEDYDRGMNLRQFDDYKARNPRIVVPAPKSTVNGPQAAMNLRRQSVPFNQALEVLRTKLNSLSLEELAEVYAAHVGGINPGVEVGSCCVTYETLQPTFMVNGAEMTVAELAELVKQYTS